MADEKREPDAAKDGGQQSRGERSKTVALTGLHEEEGLTRREIIKLAAGAVVISPLVGLITTHAADNTTAALVSQGQSARAPQFFSREEFALVDELTEMIIPTDDHSPGARAAGVAAYIDARLAESFEGEPKQLWRDGLKLIDSLSRQMHGRAFLQAEPKQRIELLTRISENEASPKKPEEIFFSELKARTARAYYSSKIGIHTEMEYKGNINLKEFVGYDAK
jgi:Gluconate 2-dehydrogenase subunit 3